MRSRPTMRDVAALAGVSFKTVSRVVNDEPGVSDDLVARVQRAAEQLDYRHNLAASNLRRGQRTMSVGVLIQDVSNSFSATMLRAIEDSARERGIVVYAASLDEEEQRERDMIADLVNRRVDGLIVMPASHDQSYLQNDVRSGLAVVIVDRPAYHLDADCVQADNVRGSRIGTSHLLAHGHRRIAFVSDQMRISTASERREGYVQAIEAAGLTVRPELMRQDVRSSAEATTAVLGLLAIPDPPTAIFAARNTVAIGAIRALRDVGRSHEVALLAFDDFPMSDLVDPAITVIRQDSHEIGRIAAELLIGRIDGDTSPSRRILMPTTLVQRGSGEIAPPLARPSTAKGRPRSRVARQPVGRAPA